MNCGDKCFSFLYSAVYLERLHNSPLYTFCGWLVTRFPFRDGFSLSLFLSVLPAVATVVLVYLSVYKQRHDRFAACVGAVTLMASWVYFAQAVKVEVYIFASFFLMLGYTSLIYKRYNFGALFFGAAATVHWITALATLAAFVLHEKELRRRWYIWGSVILGIYLIWYLGVVPFNSDADQDPFFLVNLSWSAGPISEVAQNIARFLVVPLFGGTAGWFFIGPYIRREFDKAIPLLYAFSIPLIYLLVAVADSGYMQMATVIPLLAVMAGLGVMHMKRRLAKILAVLFIFPLIALPFIWNIDSNPTTARQMINALDQVPDDGFVVALRMYHGKTDTYGGSIECLVTYYNRHSGRCLRTVNLGYLWQSAVYQEGAQRLRATGLAIPLYDDMLGATMAESIVKTLCALKDYNPDARFYYYEVTDAETMRMELAEWQTYGTSQFL